MSKTRLFDAVRRLDLAEVKAILKEKPELKIVRNDQGRNLLHLACAANNKKLKKPAAASVKMVAFLLDEGFDIEELGGAGRDLMPPIWFAVCHARNHPLVKYMIRRGAKPTGLYAAGWWEDIDILKTLVKAGADMEQVVGVTPFLACWGWRKFTAAKALATLGTNVNAQDKRGRTALHLGLEKDFDPALLKWLVQRGADPEIPNHDGVSARRKASRKRDKRYQAVLA